MIDLIEQTEDRTHFVSELTLLESRSAIRRRERYNEITPEQADAAISSLAAEQRRLVQYPISSEVMMKAQELLDSHPLRALDAIQLATALLSSSTLTAGEDQLFFVSEDQRLLSVAASEGLQVWKFDRP